MKIIAFIIILSVLAYCFRAYAGSKQIDTDGGLVTLKDIPELVAKLNKQGENGSFWVVLIPGTSKSDGYDANLQFSVEDGSIGLDWVLIADRNVQDKESFVEISNKNDLEIQELAGNGVKYVRVVGSSVFSKLAKEVLENMYGVSNETEMQLIVTGFEWK